MLFNNHHNQETVFISQYRDYASLSRHETSVNCIFLRQFKILLKNVLVQRWFAFQINCPFCPLTYLKKAYLKPMGVTPTTPKHTTPRQLENRHGKLFHQFIRRYPILYIIFSSIQLFSDWDWSALGSVHGILSDIRITVILTYKL